MVPQSLEVIWWEEVTSTPRNTQVECQPGTGACGAIPPDFMRQRNLNTALHAPPVATTSPFESYTVSTGLRSVPVTPNAPSEGPTPRISTYRSCSVTVMPAISVPPPLLIWLRTARLPSVPVFAAGLRM